VIHVRLPGAVDCSPDVGRSAIAIQLRLDDHHRARCDGRDEGIEIERDLRLVPDEETQARNQATLVADVRSGAIVPKIPEDVMTLVPTSEYADKSVKSMDDRRVYEIYPGRTRRHSGFRRSLH
jgi:hypothetical protein